MSVQEPENKSEKNYSKPDDIVEAVGDSIDINASDRPKEIGGRGGLDPTRYGDWEKAGRCIDF